MNLNNNTFLSPCQFIFKCDLKIFVWYWTALVIEMWCSYEVRRFRHYGRNESYKIEMTNICLSFLFYPEPDPYPRSESRTSLIRGISFCQWQHRLMEGVIPLYSGGSGIPQSLQQEWQVEVRRKSQDEGKQNTSYCYQVLYRETEICEPSDNVGCYLSGSRISMSFFSRKCLTDWWKSSILIVRYQVVIDKPLL